MKYFDEAYYTLCQKTSFDTALEPDSAAASGDAAYYKKLYTEKEASFLEMSGFPLGSEEGKRAFAATVDAYADELKRGLPADILTDVPDLRVLALNRAAPKTLKKIQKFCDANRRQADTIYHTYMRYYEKAAENPDFKSEMTTQIAFHDFVITQIVTQLGDLFFAFGDVDIHSYITAMRCVKCKVKNDAGLVEGAVWLYEEIYQTEDGYELDVLVQKPDGTVSEFSLSAQRFEFRGSVR